MKVFELQNGFPTITVEALMIPEFKKIWDRDKSKDKIKAYPELQYIFFSGHFKSLYLAFDPKTREERLVDDFIKIKNWKPDQAIIDAISKYKEFQNTATMRFLQANQDAMESLTDYYSSIDWDELDATGKKPKYDISKVSSSVKQAGDIINNIEKLKEKVAKEESLSKDRARGQGTGGLLEFD